ncbi:MAG: aldehyde ferredoxin oxidoreductase family protein [Anaerolineae bacterium]
MAQSAFVNLSTGEVHIAPTSTALLRRWLGGRGLGAAGLFQLTGPAIDAFDERNVLIFTTGPFNATSWPSAARYTVSFKSPATGAYGYANAGGHFGAELRRAGYDALIITGRAPQPSILRVTDEEIEIVPAPELWGLTTSRVDALLREGLGGRVASIGPAGENLVRFASIINDEGRAAARGGPGAVMGSKNLKAIHAVACRRAVETPPAFRETAKRVAQYLLAHPRLQTLMAESTLFLMQAKQGVGDLPANNHQMNQVPYVHAIDTKAFSAYWAKRTGCAGCPIRCSRRVELRVGEEVIAFEGPEFESANALGPMCGIADPEVIIRANHLCNEYGMDTISAGVTIAFAMECRQWDVLRDPQFSLEWGDADSVLGLLEQIARRQGLGGLLAEGTQRAAQQIGGIAENFAMHVKGLELPRQEPRTNKAMALGLVTSNRGADHLYAFSVIDAIGAWDVARELFPEDILPKLMNFSDETYKPDSGIYGEHFCAITDSLGICKFSTVQNYIVMPAHLAEGLQALGLDVTADELLRIGERIVNLERMYNVRHGIDRRHDSLPARFLEEPIGVYAYEPDPDSGTLRRSEEPIIEPDVVHLDAMLDRYYLLRGWDMNGIPKPETLRALGLDEALRPPAEPHSEAEQLHRWLAIQEE